MLFEYEFDLDSLINNARGNNGILSVQQANGLTLNRVTIYAFIIRRFKFVKEYSLRLHLSIAHLLTGQTMQTRSTKIVQLLSGQNHADTLDQISASKWSRKFHYNILLREEKL